MYLSSWYSTVRASYLCSTAPIRHSRAPSCSLDEILLGSGTPRRWSLRLARSTS